MFFLTHACNTPGKKVTPVYRLLGLLVAALFVGTLMPGDLKAQIETQLWHTLPWSAMAHFCLFGAMAALPGYGSGWVGPRRALYLALLLAALTELGQAWVPGRHPLLRDVAIDLSGCVAGLMLRGLWPVKPMRA